MFIDGYRDPQRKKLRGAFMYLVIVGLFVLAGSMLAQQPFYAIMALGATAHGVGLRAYRFVVDLYRYG